MDMYDETVRHVVENFPLFGFGDAETAMFQCIKELLDNSLDSLRDNTRLSGVQSDIKIHLRGVQHLIMVTFVSIFGSSLCTIYTIDS